MLGATLEFHNDTTNNYLNSYSSIEFSNYFTTTAVISISSKKIAIFIFILIAVFITLLIILLVQAHRYCVSKKTQGQRDHQNPIHGPIEDNYYEEIIPLDDISSQNRENQNTAPNSRIRVSNPQPIQQGHAPIQHRAGIQENGGNVTNSQNPQHNSPAHDPDLLWRIVLRTSRVNSLGTPPKKI